MSIKKWYIVLIVILLTSCWEYVDNENIYTNDSIEEQDYQTISNEIQNEGYYYYVYKWLQESWNNIKYIPLLNYGSLTIHKLALYSDPNLQKIFYERNNYYLSIYFDKEYYIKDWIENFEYLNKNNSQNINWYKYLKTISFYKNLRDINSFLREKWWNGSIRWHTLFPIILIENENILENTLLLIKEKLSKAEYWEQELAIILSMDPIIFEENLIMRRILNYENHKEDIEAFKKYFINKYSLSL